MSRTKYTFPFLYHRANTPSANKPKLHIYNDYIKSAITDNGEKKNTCLFTTMFKYRATRGRDKLPKSFPIKRLADPPPPIPPFLRSPVPENSRSICGSFHALFFSSIQSSQLHQKDNDSQVGEADL